MNASLEAPRPSLPRKVALLVLLAALGGAFGFCFHCCVRAGVREKASKSAVRLANVRADLSHSRLSLPFSHCPPLSLLSLSLPPSPV